MKPRTTVTVFVVLLAAGLTTGITTASAQTTRWDGSGTWIKPGSWDNGIPDATKDVVLDAIGTASLNIPDGATWNTLTATNSVSGSTLTLSAASSGSISGGSASFSSSGNGLIKITPPTAGSLTLSGSMLLSTSSSVADAVVFTVGANSSVTVNGGIYLGSSAAGQNNASLYQGAINSSNAPVINADVTFNNGSRFLGGSDAAANTVLTFNGNVTLQAGSFSGAAAYFNVGRASNAELGFTVKIRDSLSVSSGTVQIRKNRILEVGSATIGSAGTLVLTGVVNSTDDAVFRSLGNLTVNGGTLNANNATGNGGGYLLDIGGDFSLGTGSTVLLNSTVGKGITTMELAGNFNVSAVSLSSGNLNQLRLTLNGTAPQTLEAAVLSGNQTFAVNTLTLDTDYVSLVNNYVNLGADEFFKTDVLFNIGETTLDLNGLQFYVGDYELQTGVYTDFGGTLTVISVPEPSALLLLGAGFIGFLSFRGRQQRNS